jgi:hypothetical protein
VEFNFKSFPLDGNVTVHRGVAETFFRLFEEYPQSLAFFGYLGTTSMDELRKDPKLASALQEHAVRVIQVKKNEFNNLGLYAICKYQLHFLTNMMFVFIN